MSAQSGLRAWILARRSAVAPLVLLVLTAGLAVGAMHEESATFDEGAHLASGYSYAVARDFRMMPEHPPLPKVWNALPLVVGDMKFPAFMTGWTQGNVWAYGFAFLYQSGNDPDRILLRSRFFALFWALLLVASVYAVGKDLYGERGGLLSAALLGLGPVFLAHAHLATLDVCAATLGFLSVVAFWKFCTTERIFHALSCGVLLGGALGSKHSSLYLLIALPLIALVLGKAGAARFDRSSRVLWIPLLAWVTLWGLYGFRFSGTPDGSFAFAWGGDGLVAKMVRSAAALRLLPEAYLSGFLYFMKVVSHRQAFALGSFSDTGWVWYYPLAFLVTTPVTTLALVGAGGYAFARRLRQGLSESSIVGVPIAVFGGLTLLSSLAIGIRQILPLYPFLMLLAGSVPLPEVREAIRKPKQGWAWGLLAGSVLSALLAAPSFLGYFNLPSGLLGKPYEILADSNLDWGQDLARLKRFTRERGIEELHLAYFGSASPGALELRHRPLPVGRFHTQYLKFERSALPAEPLKKGDWVAISSTYLSGVYLDDRDTYRRMLPDLAFEARVGTSIWVYRVR